MKIIKLFIILLVLCNISCGLQQNVNNLFLVEGIKSYESEVLCIYQIQSYNIIEFDIIDTIGKFNIGDTLSLTKQMK